MLAHLSKFDETLEAIFAKTDMAEMMRTFLL